MTKKKIEITEAPTEEPKEEQAAAPQTEEIEEQEAVNQLESFMSMVEQLSQERDEYLDSLRRKQAEFENYRRRVNREKREIRLSAQAEVFRQLVEVLDSCEKGLESIPEDHGDSNLAGYRQGFELILSSIQNLLSKFEVAEVPGPGTVFDPNLHEAVLREIVEEGDDGEILEEFRKGYLLKDKLIRPAKVKVAVKMEPSST